MTDPPRAAALRAVIRGRVQGVGFRWHAAARAGALGLAGGVRNRHDGRVEVEAEGPRAALELFLEELQAGPSGASVEGVEVEWRPPTGAYGSFEIWPTT